MHISNCIETSLPATAHWLFGITNSKPFLCIMYICTSFLLLQIIANFMDRKVYVNYYGDDDNIPMPNILSTHY